MTKNREDRKKKVIDVLNKARAMELFAIHQYMNQHYSLDDMDYGELAANMKLIAIDEMRHAEAFAERIKMLGGEPTTQKDGKVVTGQDVPTIYASDASREDETIEVYAQFHLSYYDNISGHIQKLGDTYLAKIAGTPSSTGPANKGFVTATPAE